jgi:hypothetical protein
MANQGGQKAALCASPAFVVVPVIGVVTEVELALKSSAIV